MENQGIREICRQIAQERSAEVQRHLEQLLEKVVVNMADIEVSPAQQYALGRYFFYYLDRSGQDENIKRLLSLDSDALLDEADFWAKTPECELQLRQLSQEVFQYAKTAYTQALMKEIEDDMDLPEEDAEDAKTLPADSRAYREECLSRLEQIEQEFSRREDPYVDWEGYPALLAEAKSEILLDLDTICGETSILSLRLGRELPRQQPQTTSLPEDSGQWFAGSFKPRPWK